MLRSRLALTFVLGLALGLGACSKKKEGRDGEPSRSEKSTTLPESAEVSPEVMGYVVFFSPAQTFAQMEKLAGLAGPVPPGALQASVIQGLLKLGLKDTSVVDLKGPAGLLVLNPKKFKVPVVVGCSVKGEKQVLEAMKPTWKTKSTEGGIHELTRETVDTYRVFEGGSKNPPKVTQSLFLKFSGNMLVAASQADALKAGSGMLEEILKKAAGDMTGVIRVDHLRQVFQPELAGMAPMLKAEMLKDPSLSSIQDPEKLQWMMGWVVDKAFAFVDQTREVVFNASFSDADAVVQLGISPESDSFFAKLLAAQKHAPLKLVGAMPSDHFMVMGLNVQWDLFKADLLEFTKEIMKTLLEQELSEEAIAVFTQIWEVMGDEIAFSENMNKDGLSIVEIFSVKDEIKAKEVFEKSFAIMSKLMGDNTKGMMGMKVAVEGPEDIGKHDGVDLQAFHINMDISGMDELQAAAIKKMYGDKLTMVLATFDKRVALAMGQTAQADVEAAIDRSRGKGPAFNQSVAFESAAGPLGKDTGGFVFLSISRLIDAGIQATYAAMDKPAPDIKLSTKSGMFIGFKTANQRMVASLRVPAEHFKEIGEAIRQMSSLNQ